MIEILLHQVSDDKTLAEKIDGILQAADFQEARIGTASISYAKSSESSQRKAPRIEIRSENISTIRSIAQALRNADLDMELTSAIFKGIVATESLIDERVALTCPQCHNPMASTEAGFHCPHCGRNFVHGDLAVVSRRDRLFFAETLNGKLGEELQEAMLQIPCEYKGLVLSTIKVAMEGMVIMDYNKSFSRLDATLEEAVEKLPVSFRDKMRLLLSRASQFAGLPTGEVKKLISRGGWENPAPQLIDIWLARISRIPK